ncbi:MAG: TonB-dependent hemoglobin/transferrin/lactoferrin family receptor [Leptolyngbya sp. SIO4C5]|nr:TonB-dependent hemoglobin/transferrin/lactoferrin family receptor [Leptolyngbya sp. SIO4C5]
MIAFSAPGRAESLMEAIATVDQVAPKSAKQDSLTEFSVSLTQSDRLAVISVVADTNETFNQLAPAEPQPVLAEAPVVPEQITTLAQAEIEAETEANPDEAEVDPDSEPEETNDEAETSNEADEAESDFEFSDDFQLRITVTGTRTPLEVDELPGTVTVFDLEDIQFYQAQDLRDLLRYEPGVSVRNNLRYGLQDVNIRGIEGNRVLFQLDGIRLPERFEFGPFNVGRGDYVDFATLQAVEVLRGPASTLYGSDALGGVVTFRSLEPSDLLEPGEDFAADLSTTYISATGGFENVARLAGREDNLETVLVVSRRDSRESDVRADERFIDSQDRAGVTFYGNLVYRFSDTQSLSFIAEDFGRDTRTTTADDNLGGTTSRFVEDILINRSRFSLTYEYDDPDSLGFLQFARAQVYYQDSTEIERNLENRITSGIPVLRDTENRFVADSYGGDVQLRSDFSTGALEHRLTYGFDISSTFNSRPRDRIQTNLLTGEASRNIPPDVFPVKDFPDGDTLRLGVYVQDEIEVGDFDLIAGLRFDHYDLSTDADQAFNRNGAESANLTASAFSPRIALRYEATPELSFYGQYARGFRAPLYSEINSGFTNTTSPFFKYQTISNPELEPETSDSFELGMRGNFDQFDFRLTGFYNTYDNFIATFQSAGTRCLVVANPCPGFSPPFSFDTQIVNVFQTQNVAEARIYGVEFGGEYRFNPEGYGWSLLGSLAWAQGDDLTDDVPLDTVDPFTAVVGLRYRAPEDKWRAELIGTLVGRARVEAGTTTKVPDAYAILDFISSYQVTPTFGLSLGVYNLFNTRYFNYSDVRTIPADAVDINRYSQAGTNVRVGVNLTF